MASKRFSLFKTFSPFWRALDTSTKNIWKSAGAFNGLSGWQLFVSDNAARLNASLELGVPVSQLWQVATGNIVIDSPANKILLSQVHNKDSVVARKVRGASWKFELVALREDFGLPLEIQIRYTSNLTPVGGEQRARFFARVWSSYQGRDIYRDLILNFEEVQDWTLIFATLPTTYGYIIGYTLYIDIFGYTGTLKYDNVRAIHSGQNWARDPSCNEINKNFTGGFAQVLPFWTPEDVPAGASYFSRYGAL
jgi:hypothetical protein